MNILFFTSSYPRFPGDGTAPFVKSIAEAMAFAGHRVDVVAPYDPLVQPAATRNPAVHRFKYAPLARMHVIGHARSLAGDTALKASSWLMLPLFCLAGVVKLIQVARKSHSQCLYAHWVVPGGFIAGLASLILRIPLLISLHGSDIYLANRNPLARLGARFAFSRAKAVTACSQDLLSAAQQLGAPTHIRLVPWGADPDRFTPQHRSNSYREHLGVAAGDLVVTCLGRMVPKKGFAVALQAVLPLFEKIPSLRLVMAGSGPELPALQAAVQGSGWESRVCFPGPAAWGDVPTLLASSDIFLLPSVKDASGNQDGLPTVLLEAMACGLPVIASNIAGVPLVLRQGLNGILVPPGDSGALASALQDLAEHPELRIKLAQAARLAVCDEYNWQAVSARLLGILQQIQAGSPPKPRLGTLYRQKILESAGILRLHPHRILDLGSHDGAAAAAIPARLRVGVDLSPARGNPQVEMIRADATALPLKPRIFDLVLALDVIEHVANDSGLARSAVDALAPGGLLFLSTPSSAIRLFPAFLTGWISRSWGHHLRRGYTQAQLERLFAGCTVEILEWSAPAWRTAYLPLRAVYAFWPDLSKKVLDKVFAYDNRHRAGPHGYYLVRLSHRENEASRL